MTIPKKGRGASKGRGLGKIQATTLTDRRRIDEFTKFEDPFVNCNFETSYLNYKEFCSERGYIAISQPSFIKIITLRHKRALGTDTVEELRKKSLKIYMQQVIDEESFKDTNHYYYYSQTVLNERYCYPVTLSSFNKSLARYRYLYEQTKPSKTKKLPPPVNPTTKAEILQLKQTNCFLKTVTPGEYPWEEIKEKFVKWAEMENIPMLTDADLEQALIKDHGIFKMIKKQPTPRAIMSSLTTTVSIGVT